MSVQTEIMCDCGRQLIQDSEGDLYCENCGYDINPVEPCGHDNGTVKEIYYNI